LVATQFASIIMIVTIEIISYILAPEHTEVIWQGMIGAAAMFISYLLLRKGKLEAAGWLIAVLGWLILTLDLAFISGIRGVNVLGQVLIVLFVGLTISGKSALIITFVNAGMNKQIILVGLFNQSIPL